MLSKLCPMKYEEDDRATISMTRTHRVAQMSFAGAGILLDHNLVDGVTIGRDIVRSTSDAWDDPEFLTTTVGMITAFDGRVAMSNVLSVLKLKTNVGIMGSDRNVRFCRNLCHCKLTGIPCSVFVSDDAEEQFAFIMDYCGEKLCQSLPRSHIMYMLVSQCLYSKQVISDETVARARIMALERRAQAAARAEVKAKQDRDASKQDASKQDAAVVVAEEEAPPDEPSTSEPSTSEPSTSEPSTSATSEPSTSSSDWVPVSSMREVFQIISNIALNVSKRSTDRTTAERKEQQAVENMEVDEVVINLPKFCNQQSQTDVTGNIVAKPQQRDKKCQAVARTSHFAQQTECINSSTRYTQTTPRVGCHSAKSTQTNVLITFSKGTQDDRTPTTSSEAQTVATDTRADGTQTSSAFAAAAAAVHTHTQTCGPEVHNVDTQTDVAQQQRIAVAEKSRPTQTVSPLTRCVCIQTETADVTPVNMDPKLKDFYKVQPTRLSSESFAASGNSLRHVTPAEEIVQASKATSDDGPGLRDSTVPIVPYYLCKDIAQGVERYFALVPLLPKDVDLDDFAMPNPPPPLYSPIYVTHEESPELVMPLFATPPANVPSMELPALVPQMHEQYNEQKHRQKQPAVCPHAYNMQYIKHAVEKLNIKPEPPTSPKQVSPPHRFVPPRRRQGKNRQHYEPPPPPPPSQPASSKNMAGCYGYHHHQPGQTYAQSYAAAAAAHGNGQYYRRPTRHYDVEGSEYYDAPQGGGSAAVAAAEYSHEQQYRRPPMEQQPQHSSVGSAASKERMELFSALYSANQLAQYLGVNNDIENMDTFSDEGDPAKIKRVIVKQLKCIQSAFSGLTASALISGADNYSCKMENLRMAYIQQEACMLECVNILNGIHVSMLTHAFRHGGSSQMCAESIPPQVSPVYITSPILSTITEGGQRIS